MQNAKANSGCTAVAVGSGAALGASFLSTLEAAAGNQCSRLQRLQEKVHHISKKVLGDGLATSWPYSWSVALWRLTEKA